MVFLSSFYREKNENAKYSLLKKPPVVYSLLSVYWIVFFLIHGI